jgi:hypothetical protein
LKSFFFNNGKVGNGRQLRIMNGNISSLF